MSYLSRFLITSMVPIAICPGFSGSVQAADSVMQITCLCDVRTWDNTPIAGAQGTLLVAGVHAVSNELGHLDFVVNVAGVAGFREGRQLPGYTTDREEFLLNGRTLLEVNNSRVFQPPPFIAVARQGRRRIAGFGSRATANSSYSTLRSAFNAQRTGFLMANGYQTAATVVDTVVVSKPGYHRGKALIVGSYYYGELIHLVPLPNSDSIPLGMVHIPKGEFVMGSEDGDPDETPIRTVHLSSFYMDTVEVIQAEYESVLGVTPWNTVDSTDREDKGDDYPAYAVNWFDAVLFCNAKSKAHGRDTVYTWSSIEGTLGDGCRLGGVEIHLDRRGFRLPTEAEWEYACRAGSNTKYFWGSTLGPATEYAWYQENSGFHAHPVGLKETNWFGLHDIIGNVYEWTNDTGDRNYDDSQTLNPIDLRPSPTRVARGGAFPSPGGLLRSTDRGGNNAGEGRTFIGFRTVLSDWE